MIGYELKFTVAAAGVPSGLGREYFEQALIDREVFVFYTYPGVEGESIGE